MSTGLKYRTAERHLRAMIAEQGWSPGERLPSEQSLAQRFGVSYMTMRRAMAILEEEGLVRRISGRGTILNAVAPNHPEAPSAPVCLVLPKLWSRLDPYYFPDVVRGFLDEVGSGGGHGQVVDGATAALTANAPVAVLLIDRHDADFLDELKDRRHPVIAVNRYPGRRRVASIAADNDAGAHAATRKLIEAGHRDIVFLRGNKDNLDAGDRAEGYHRAMEEAGLEPVEAGSGFAEQYGYEATRGLLRQGSPPTAIFAASDLAALGAMRAAQERGLSIPADLSIVGFGDFALHHLGPKLVTVHLPREELGRQAARALLALQRGDSPKSVTLAARLLPGDTISQPRSCWTPNREV